MRLKWGPHARELAEQVIIRDPQYVVATLADEPAGALASVFQTLITRFDAHAFACPCARCRRTADGVYAYPGSVAVIGFCARCALVSLHATPAPATRVSTYEAALRHVARTFPRGHRIHMRRIISALVLAKGGPARATEPAAVRFLTP